MGVSGQKVGSRWKELFETCRPHSEDHVLAFNDAHVLMCLLGAGDMDAVVKVIDSLSEYVR